MNFNDGRDDGWQWHQQHHKQIMCILFQTDNHNSTSPLSQGDHSPDTMKFPDISLTMRGTHAHVKWYS